MIYGAAPLSKREEGSLCITQSISFAFIQLRTKPSLTPSIEIEHRLDDCSANELTPQTGATDRPVTI